MTSALWLIEPRGTIRSSPSGWSVRVHLDAYMAVRSSMAGREGASRRAPAGSSGSSTWAPTARTPPRGTAQFGLVVAPAPGGQGREAPVAPGRPQQHKDDLCAVDDCLALEQLDLPAAALACAAQPRPGWCRQPRCPIGRAIARFEGLEGMIGAVLARAAPMKTTRSPAHHLARRGWSLGRGH